MAKNSRYWTAGTLKGRGWTEALIAELLPEPHYWHSEGRRIRSWSREAVRLAEETPRFQAAKAARAARQAAEQADAGGEAETALQKTAAFLAAAWQETPRPEGNAARLALYYHDAILKQLSAAAWADRLKTGTAMSYLDAFFSLAKQASSQHRPGILRRFVSAGVWMGRNLEHGLVQRVYANYGRVLLALAEAELSDFAAAQPGVDPDGLLRMERFPSRELLSHSLGYVYSVCYVPAAIRTSLHTLVALNPKDEYPEARAMQRHFVLHLGGTNTGKTYAGFQRLKEAGTGVYLAPLRLLALEAQERLLDDGVACALTTGEEEDWQEGDTHVAATAEKLDLKRRWDVAVIDECQMIADAQRGFAWTRAILGVLAPEIHLCAAPEARQILLRLIRACGDTWEIVQHRRKTPLVPMERTVDFDQLQPGDALITFSKMGVLSVAEELRSRGREPAIIYGALPYGTRRRQMEGFLEGRMQYVVSTDAIGMGLNLPIRRVIFLETEKFDGVERRELKPEEIQQIAGRAGRYGMYDKGYVGAMENLAAVRAGLEAVVPPIQYAVAGFSDLVLQVEFDLLEVLEQWNRMPTAEPYRKQDISRYITLITKLREAGFHLTREQELRAANIPFDETESELLELFYRFLRVWQAGEALPRPEPPQRERPTLPELELYCRKLDLYFSFSKAFSMAVDRDALYDERERIADQINQILLHNLKNNIRVCRRCGTPLPLYQTGRLCRNCSRRTAGGGSGRRRR